MLCPSGLQGLYTRLPLCTVSDGLTRKPPLSSPDDTPGVRGLFVGYRSRGREPRFFYWRRTARIEQNGKVPACQRNDRQEARGKISWWHECVGLSEFLHLLGFTLCATQWTSDWPDRRVEENVFFLHWEDRWTPAKYTCQLQAALWCYWARQRWVSEAFARSGFFYFANAACETLHTNGNCSLTMKLFHKQSSYPGSEYSLKKSVTLICVAVAFSNIAYGMLIDRYLFWENWRADRKSMRQYRLDELIDTLIRVV